MKKDLDEMETFFSKYPFCFLLSPEGIIFLSSKPAMVLKSLWPLDKTAQEKLIASQQFGNKPFEAVMKREIADGMEVTLEGADYFVSRKVIDSEGWSIVLLTSTDHVRIYKLIGILITIGVCLLIVFFSGIIYVTDRSREAIRQSEELYKALAEKSLAGVYVVQDGKFRFINSNAASYAGYIREELLNQDASILVNPEDREQVRQNARAMLLGEMSSPYEFRIITKQGETRWIMETVTTILHEGRPAILGNSMNITERKRAEGELQRTIESLRKAFGTVIQVMVSAVETRDPYTAGHQVRSADLARSIATEMGLPQEKIDGIRMAGSIHDIGKLSVPAEILSKPTRLTELEFSLIKEHSRKGYEMLKDVESPWPLADIVYQHHERMDGSGYPRHLKGEEILMEARIMAVADVVESMASHRPYRPALGIDTALNEIEKNRGTHYDNAVADACLKLFREKRYKLE